MNINSQYPCTLEELKQEIKKYEENNKESDFPIVNVLYDYAMLRFGINLKLKWD